MALNQSLSDRASNVAQFVAVYPTVHLKAGAPDEAAGQLGAASVWPRVLDLHGNQVASQGPPLAGVPDNLLGTLVPGVRDTGSLRLLVFPLIRLGHLFGYVQAITTDSQLQTDSTQLLDSMLAPAASSQ